MLLSMQQSTAQIAADMSISVNTVRTRVRQALRKLGADDRPGAVQIARDRGLVGDRGEPGRAPLAGVS